MLKIDLSAVVESNVKMLLRDEVNEMEEEFGLLMTYMVKLEAPDADVSACSYVHLLFCGNVKVFSTETERSDDEVTCDCWRHLGDSPTEWTYAVHTALNRVCIDLVQEINDERMSLSGLDGDHSSLSLSSVKQTVHSIGPIAPVWVRHYRHPTRNLEHEDYWRHVTSVVPETARYNKETE